MTNIDPYSWWREAVARVARGEPVPPVNVNQPQPGRYRRRKEKDGPWLPAAIWIDMAGATRCVVDEAHADPSDEWTWLASHPITAEVYHYRITHGIWPDEADRKNQTVIVTDIGKVFKKFRGNVELLHFLQQLATTHYRDTGKLAPGTDIQREQAA